MTEVDSTKTFKVTQWGTLERCATARSDKPAGLGVKQEKRRGKFEVKLVYSKRTAKSLLETQHKVNYENSSSYDMISKIECNYQQATISHPRVQTTNYKLPNLVSPLTSHLTPSNFKHFHHTHPCLLFYFY